MMNPIKYIANRRRDKKTTARLKEVSSVFGFLTRLEKNGLIWWEKRFRRLFITEPLAVVMLAQGAERWTNFLNNVYLFVYYKNLQEQWTNSVVSIQAKAVREAKAKNARLSKADIDAVRREARENIDFDRVTLPEPKVFEFFVVHGENHSAKNMQTTLVGTYDPDTDAFDIVEWERVVPLLQGSDNS